jgi:hypothetical protein
VGNLCFARRVPPLPEFAVEAGRLHTYNLRIEKGIITAFAAQARSFNSSVGESSK